MHYQTMLAMLLDERSMLAAQCRVLGQTLVGGGTLATALIEKEIRQQRPFQPAVATIEKSIGLQSFRPGMARLHDTNPPPEQLHAERSWWRLPLHLAPRVLQQELRLPTQ